MIDMKTVVDNAWNQFLLSELTPNALPEPSSTHPLTAEVERIGRERKERIIAAADGLMLRATPAVLDAMIARALENGRDAQRAGERILEHAGVLQRQGELGEVDRVDVLAARIYYKARQVIETVAVAPALPDTPSPANST